MTDLPMRVSGGAQAAPCTPSPSASHAPPMVTADPPRSLTPSRSSAGVSTPTTRHPAGRKGKPMQRFVLTATFDLPDDVFPHARAITLLEAWIETHVRPNMPENTRADDPAGNRSGHHDQQHREPDPE